MAAKSSPVNAPSALHREGGSRFAMNVASNVVYLGFTTGAMLFYVPFLIDRLGVAAYGVVPLAHAITTQLATVVDGLCAAIMRYLSIDLNRGDHDAANRTFNASMLASATMIGLTLPIGIAVVWFFPSVFRTPEGMELDAQVLAGGVLATWFLSLIDNILMIPAIALHRFDLRNGVRTLTMVTRMGLPIACFAILPPRLWQVGAGFFLGGLVSLAGNWAVCRALTPSLRLDRSSVDPSRLRELIGFSTWAIINSSGMLLFLSVDIMIVNRFYGPTVSGQFGVVTLPAELLRNLFLTVAAVVAPMIITHYARGDFDALRMLSVRALRLFGVFLALPVGLMCGLAGPLLSLWLGAEFERLDTLLIALTGHLCVTLATWPLSQLLTAFNKVRAQGIVTVLLGLLNLCLGLAAAYFDVFGPVGVAGATALSLTARNLVLLSGLSARAIGVPAVTFYRPLVNGAVGAVVLGIVVHAIAQAWRPGSWLDLGLISVAAGVIYVAASYAFSLESSERAFVRRWLIRLRSGRL